MTLSESKLSKMQLLSPNLLILILRDIVNKEKYGSENVNYAIKSGLLKNIVDLVPVTSQKGKRKKTSSLSQVDKIKVFSDYVVMIQTF